MRNTLKTLSILLSYPGEDLKKLINYKELLYELLKGEDEDVAGMIRDFLSTVDTERIDEMYVSIFEMPAKCPLYAHHYVVKEDELGRFLLEIKGMYKLKGYDLIAKGEIPDYLPAMLEFLSLIVDRDPRTASRFAKRYIRTWIGRLLECTERNRSPYAILIKALSKVIDDIISSQAF